MVIKKFNKDKDWLYQKRFVEKLTLKEIAKLTNVSIPTVMDYLHKYDLIQLQQKRGRPFNTFNIPSIDKDLLHKLYYENHPIKEIAEIFKCSIGNVHLMRKKYGFSPRMVQSHQYKRGVPKKGEDWLKIDKELLTKLYTVDRKSKKEIAKILNCPVSTITCRLEKFSVPKMTMIEAIMIARNRTDYDIYLSKESVDFINGELIGDASIIEGSRIEYASHLKSYISYLSKTLSSFGIQEGKVYHQTYTGKENKISKMNNSSKFDERIYHASYYRSKSYQCIKDLYNNWYLDGFCFCPYCEILFHDETCNRSEWEHHICPVCNEHRVLRKVVPEDIDLTPITCRQWFIGDGSNSYGSISFSTCGFLLKDVKLLQLKLKNLGFESSLDEKNRVVRMNVDSTRNFLHYIGPCPVPCYNYKWFDRRKLPCPTKRFNMSKYDGNPKNFCNYALTIEDKIFEQYGECTRIPGKVKCQMIPSCRTVTT